MVPEEFGNMICRLEYGDAEISVQRNDAHDLMELKFDFGDRERDVVVSISDGAIEMTDENELYEMIRLGLLNDRLTRFESDEITDVDADRAVEEVDSRLRCKLFTPVPEREKELMEELDKIDDEEQEMLEKADKYDELEKILMEMTQKGLVCKIFAGQMFEVVFYSWEESPPETVFKSLDLLTAIKGARKMREKPEQDQEGYDEFIESEIKLDKMLRKNLDAELQRLKALDSSDERDLAMVRLKECIMWLGMDLKRLGGPNPYPESYNPDSPVVEQTADGLEL